MVEHDEPTSTTPPADDVMIERGQYEDRFRHRLSLPEASRFDEKRLRDMGNMYAAYNMMVRTASPVVNGQNSERPLHMGNPGVLGLWSFAVVTILLGVFRLFLPWKPANIILPTALMFGGLSQLIAGFADLFVGGTFSGAILISYGAFWSGNGIMFFPDTVIGATAEYANAEDLAQARAIYDIIWALYTLMLACLSLKIRSGTFNLTFNLFFVFLALLLNGCHFLTNPGLGENLIRASGVCCILAAVGAFYSGIAAVLEEQGIHCGVGHYPWTKNM
ncbi:GPR1/FUN34/yaaH family-domain-containing protein [Absidia repens]|uniref:GPR1/FUN34/yaaH family-domain-containing protein n=1 Tax=Absidia repens TaxID=90262 RepID=A0A1X2I621_9FUNG|nr:GPR1/FUN34/yaaH family-domain-containing protein [Absidia repens]